MNRFCCVSLFDLWLACIASAQNLATPNMTPVPLLDCSGLPCVDLTTGSGQTLRLLIDLGERNAWLATNAARRLGLEAQAMKGADGASVPEVQQTVVAGAKLGDLPMGDFPFVLIDNTPQPKAAGAKVEMSQPLPADGALTYGAFVNRLVQLDFANHQLRVSAPLTEALPCPGSCSGLIIKHFGRFGPATITADGFAVNGQSLDAQIDTLFSGTLLIYPASVEKLGLKKEKKGKAKRFPFTQGGVELREAETVSESFRGLELLRDAPLYFTTKDEDYTNIQFDGTAGLGLLQRARVTFDFKGNQFWMEPAR